MCEACALTQRRIDDGPLNITFRDYAVAYRILEPAFAATSHGIHKNELAVVQAVEKLTSCRNEGTTVKEIAVRLGWSDAAIYKYVDLARRNKRLRFADGTRVRNLKLILPMTDASSRFLPRPATVFRNNKEIGDEAAYIDPITGESKTYRRN